MSCKLFEMCYMLVYGGTVVISIIIIIVIITSIFIVVTIIVTTKHGHMKLFKKPIARTWVVYRIAPHNSRYFLQYLKSVVI